MYNYDIRLKGMRD